VARAEEQGAGTGEQRARILENAAARYQRAISQTGQAVNDNARSYGLASHQIQNLSFQLNDLAVQIGSGGGIFRPLLQQGAQVVQILQQGEGGIRGGLTALGQSLKSIGPAAISGFGAAVAAIGGVTAAVVAGVSAVNDYREQYNELQRVLKTGAGRQAGLKPGDVQGAAEAASAASKAAGGALSSGEARAVGIELAKTGKIGKEVMTDLTAQTEAYAKTLGIDTPAAAAKLAGAFADPAKGADMLARELLSLSAAQVAQIGTMARMGDRLGAQKALMDGLKDGVVDLKDQVLTATIVWERFKAAALSDADLIAKKLGEAAMPKTAEQRIADIKALPGTGLGGQVTPEDAQRRADAILKIQTDASAKALEQTRRDEAAKRNEVALTANAITLSINSSIGKFQELQDQSTRLAEAMRHPELLADQAATAAALDTVRNSLGGATTAAEYYAVTLTRMKDQGNLALQAIYAQTQASLALTETDRRSAEVLQAKVAQQQAELAATQAGLPLQQIAIAGEQAYAQAMAQSNAARAIAVQQGAKQIAQGALDISNIGATTVALRAKIAAEQSMLQTEGSLLTMSQRLALAEQARQRVVAQAAATLRDMIAAQQDDIRMKEAEISSLGMEDTARAKLLARMQAENELRRQGIDLTSAQAQAYIANAQKIAELTAKLEQKQRAEQADQEATNQAAAAQRDYAAAMDERRRSVENALIAQKRFFMAGGGPGGTFQTGEFSAKGPMTASTPGAMNFIAGSGPHGVRFGGTHDEIDAILLEQFANEFARQGFSSKKSELLAQEKLGQSEHPLMLRKAQEGLIALKEEEAGATKKVTESLEDLNTSAIQTRIDQLRGLQEAALQRPYHPDPYAERNPEFFYNGEKIFRESQDKIYLGLQTQIEKLETLQTSLATIAGQNAALPQTLVDALRAAGFSDIAEKIVGAMSSAPAPSATPPQTAVQPPGTNQFQGYGGRSGGFVSVGL
jgi:hypothetical protein